MVKESSTSAGYSLVLMCAFELAIYPVVIEMVAVGSGYLANGGHMLASCNMSLCIDEVTE